MVLQVYDITLIAEVVRSLHRRPCYRAWPVWFISSRVLGWHCCWCCCRRQREKEDKKIRIKIVSSSCWFVRSSVKRSGLPPAPFLSPNAGGITTGVDTHIYSGIEHGGQTAVAVCIRCSCISLCTFQRVGLPQPRLVRKDIYRK